MTWRETPARGIPSDTGIPVGSTLSPPGTLSLSAKLTCVLYLFHPCFFACFGVRTSWPKLQLGRKITWIGWKLNFLAERKLASSAEQT